MPFYAGASVAAVAVVPPPLADFLTGDRLLLAVVFLLAAFFAGR